MTAIFTKRKRAAKSTGNDRQRQSADRSPRHNGHARPFDDAVWRKIVSRSPLMEEVFEFFGGPLDGHVQTVSLPSDELNDVAAIPVNQHMIEMLSGHRWQPKGPATSIAVYLRQDDGAGGQYHYLRSSKPAKIA